MNTYHCPISDQPNERIRRQQRQAHNQGILQGLETIILLAGVHDEEEDWRSRGWAGQSVLNCRALRVKLWRDSIFSDILVVSREWVAHQTKGTNPDASSNIHVAAI